MSGSSHTFNTTANQSIDLEHWYRLDNKKVFMRMKSRNSGLTSSEVTERLAVAGFNELKEKRNKSIIEILLAQLKDLMILILIVAAVVSGVVGDFHDTIVILIIVLLNAIIGFLQEYNAEKALQSLKRMTTTEAKVTRDGEIRFVSDRELVPGDIVHLEAGNAVPADLRIIRSIHLTVEEASLTGESLPVYKTTEPIQGEELPIGDRTNMAYKGTFVTGGRGAGVVVATGMETEVGTIAARLQEPAPPTPLQQRMSAFSKKLSIVVLGLIVLFFVAGWVRGEDIFKMILTSISLGVAAIPEALPAVITISLALAAKRLARHQTLIRKLSTVETLGSVTYICTDKTGTLTKNKMHVEKIFVDGRQYNALDRSVADASNFFLLLNAMALNNDAVSDGHGYKGDSTEVALLELAKIYDIPEDLHPRLAEIAFDSRRKLMTTFHSWNGKFVSFTKGAPDILLQNCTGIDDVYLRQQVDDMAASGLRVLGFSYRIWDHVPLHFVPEKIECDMRFLGLAGLIDPPREEVIDAIAQCKAAGIVPVMITGDHPLTAIAIAQRIGLLTNDNDLVVTGRELSAMDHEELKAVVEKIKVYARVSPDQKLQIVKALQNKGQFVAMTGDGVNDAPSLKRANIGIAMGLTGTDVSKDAAHMILMDDNFSTIIRAIREGRRIYDNILKFIKYLMATNSGELWTLLLGPLIGLPIALLPIHILWINLISDGLPAIALSFEKAEKDIMKRSPRPPQESIFANGRGFHIVWVGLLITVVALSTQALAIKHHLHWQTIVFNVICLSQMAHVMAIRSDYQSLFHIGLFTNKPLIFSVALSFLLQLAVTNTPSLQSFFHTESLSIPELLGIGLVCSIIFIAVEIEKMFKRKKLQQPFER